MLYEGGIRVPGAVQWPGEMKEGLVTDEPVHAVDLLPTLLGRIAAPQAELLAEQASGRDVLAAGAGTRQELIHSSAGRACLGVADL